MAPSRGGLLTVVRTGPQALIQDGGRPGYAHLGVPPSGALDLPALGRANRLVGNAPDAAGIEAVLGGLTLRCDVACLVAVAGALPPGVWDTAVRLRPGEELRIGRPRAGLRCYVAVSGGIAVPPVMGSRSTDVLSGIGPPALSAGDTLPIGPFSWPVHRSPAARLASRLPGGDPSGVTAPASPGPEAGGPVEVPVLPGPREDWFDPPAAEQLAGGSWTVSPAGNRVGVRLDGTALRRGRRFVDVELPTEPVVTGAVQVPPDGRPVIFLNDHPTTGGYPVVAVVHPDALPVIAQSRPGTTLRLIPHA
jgi:biotin-dependent carboxylase-like uncharacterized protein